MPPKGSKRKAADRAPDAAPAGEAASRRSTRHAAKAVKQEESDDASARGNKKAQQQVARGNEGAGKEKVEAASTLKSENVDDDKTSSTRTGGYPTTPDGHYFLVRCRLWRCADPSLPAEKRSELQKVLMTARRNLTGRITDAKVREEARQEVQRTKVALGERGDVWWDEGEVADRKMVWNTGYKDWWEGLSEGDRKGQRKSK
ncbi:hypothetical protein BCV69DRAFT_297480 [Microstroma glucosiphilum]|uniref:Uncharacterized protein n=1 Tax=Pseudomicrostroma glucosiphilum TaxID=1684307 RepID=A0A316UAI6_9BASI|nr:hypothetical protein BCV69DRAFT_297480 [Pseudomicrostroma glucosiphilum]PWN22179.1 hypothetical protein BCV69DRAFT_297480 [Pseudomicrostroma glucosiphilum]